MDQAEDSGENLNGVWIERRHGRLRVYARLLGVPGTAPGEYVVYPVDLGAVGAEELLTEARLNPGRIPSELLAAETYGAVAAARVAGLSWTRIARLLGTSRTSAFRKYAPYCKDLGEPPQGAPEASEDGPRGEGK